MSKGLLDVVKEWREQQEVGPVYADEAQPFVDRLLALERELYRQSERRENWVITARTAYEQSANALHAILHGEQPPIQGEGRET